MSLWHASKSFLRARRSFFWQRASASATSSSASRDVGVAGVEQAEAAIVAKAAEKRSLEANLEQAREQLAQANWELERCQLYAPFTGEVSEVFVEAGGYVQPGQPVAHLVMMDPIQVDVAVSADTLRTLERYAPVHLSIRHVSTRHF